MDRKYYVYIASNITRSVLYIGVTGNMRRRIGEHKERKIQGFTSKYFVTTLLYIEEHSDIYTALKREKRLKKYPRKWKENLIAEFNPERKDLYGDLM